MEQDFNIQMKFFDEFLTEATVDTVDQTLAFLVDKENFTDGTVHNLQGTIETDTEDGIQVPETAERGGNTTERQNLRLLSFGGPDSLRISFSPFVCSHKPVPSVYRAGNV